MKTDQHGIEVKYGDPLGILLTDKSTGEIEEATIYKSGNIILNDGTKFKTDLEYDEVWEDLE